MVNTSSVGVVNEEYFGWIYDLVCPKGSYHGHTYKNLLGCLDEIEFTYILSMDKNRVEDGLDLRYRFGHEEGYSDSIINACINIRPCSVLEMMVALAIRCENHIMWDPEIGNRTADWFWAMIENLGLGGLHDSHFRYDVHRNYINEVVLRFLNREYDSDGHGSLFVIENSPYDLRNEEIWYQMCWYLNDILGY